MTSPSLTGRPLTVLLRNVNAGGIPAAAVVVLASSADAGFDTTTSVGDYRALGVTTAPVAPGERGRIQIAGTVLTRVSGAVARGAYLQTSGSAGRLSSTGTSSGAATPPPAGSCAVALEAGVDGDLVLVEFIGATPPAGTGGGGGITVEDAQDAVGTIMTDTPEINFTYDDALATISAILNPASVVAGKLTMATGRLIGRTTAGAGAGEEIAVGAGLTLVGGVLASSITQYNDEAAQDAVGGILTNSAEVAFAYVDATPSISASLITNSVAVSRLTMATARLVGRTTASAGPGEEIGIGTGLTLTGGVLAASAASFPGFGNPTASVTLAVQNGVAGTAMRSDAAPPLSQAIVPTWTGLHTFQNRILIGGNVASVSPWHVSDQTLAPTADGTQIYNYIGPTFAPAAGRSIAAVNTIIVLRTGSVAGSISSAAALQVASSYGATIPSTTVYGIRVDNMGQAGVGQSQAIGVKAQVGTGPSPAFAVISEGGENRFVGPVVFNNLSAAVAPIQLTGTVLNIYGYLGEASYPTGGSQIRPIWVTSTLSPSTNLTYAIGASITPFMSPPAGITIGEARGIHAGLFTGSTGGAITLGIGLVANCVYGIKPQSAYGVDILNFGAAGINTSIGLFIEAQSGATTSIALLSAGGQNRLVGPTAFGVNAAPLSGFAIDVQAGLVIVRSPLTLSTLDSALWVSSSINNTASTVGGLHVGPTFTGAGDLPIGLLVRPFFQPSAAINEAMGGSLAAIHNGGNVTTLVGFRAIGGSFSNTGVLGSVDGLRVDTPVFTGTLRATTARGLNIQNQGVAGVTNAFGIMIANQTGATNNWMIGFLNTDTTAGAGAIVGRVPVYFQGLAGGAGGTAYIRLYAN